MAPMAHNWRIGAATAPLKAATSEGSMLGELVN
jgi:hypothetical protein